MGLSDARTKLVRRLHRRKTREREGLVLVEGPHAAAEAVAAGLTVRFAVVSPRVRQIDAGEVMAFLDGGVETHEVEDRELGELADTEAPQGLLLVVEQPTPSWPPAQSPDLAHMPDRWLVLDAVQDPGNVGTLVRAAAAFACTGVMALDGTADPWGTKAVRASAGAAFHVPIHLARGRPFAEVGAVLPRPLLAAEMGGADPRRYTGARWTLAVGNEGAGIRPELLESADARVSVPMPGRAESLNAAVAGAILLYALGDP